MRKIIAYTSFWIGAIGVGFAVMLAMLFIPFIGLYENLIHSDE